MAIGTVHDLMKHGLEDIYAAEHIQLKALSEMARNSGTDELRTILREHREETRNQVKRLKQVFKNLGEKAKSSQGCPTVEGMAKEERNFLKERPAKPLRDAFHAEAAMKAEQYEIISYEQLVKMADALGLSEEASLLRENLDEEQKAFDKLKSFSDEYDENLRVQMPA